MNKVLIPLLLSLFILSISLPGFSKNPNIKHRKIANIYYSVVQYGAKDDSAADPESNAFDMYQDFGQNHWHNNLIWGEDLENIAIAGHIYQCKNTTCTECSGIYFKRCN